MGGNKKTQNMAPERRDDDSEPKRMKRGKCNV